MQLLNNIDFQYQHITTMQSCFQASFAAGQGEHNCPSFSLRLASRLKLTPPVQCHNEEEELIDVQCGAYDAKVPQNEEEDVCKIDLMEYCYAMQESQSPAEFGYETWRGGGGGGEGGWELKVMND